MLPTQGWGSNPGQGTRSRCHMPQLRSSVAKLKKKIASAVCTHGCSIVTRDHANTRTPFTVTVNTLLTKYLPQKMPLEFFSANRALYMLQRGCLIFPASLLCTRHCSEQLNALSHRTLMITLQDGPYLSKQLSNLTSVPEPGSNKVRIWSKQVSPHAHALNRCATSPPKTRCLWIPATFF